MSQPPSCSIQALSALLFISKEVLKEKIGRLKQVERASNPTRRPVVLTRARPLLASGVGLGVGEVFLPVRLIFRRQRRIVEHEEVLGVFLFRSLGEIEKLARVGPCMLTLLKGPRQSCSYGKVRSPPEYSLRLKRQHARTDPDFSTPI